MTKFLLLIIFYENLELMLKQHGVARKPMFAAPKTSGLVKKNKFIDLSEGRASGRS